MSVQVQVRVTRRPKPAPEPSDAPTTDGPACKMCTCAMPYVPCQRHVYATVTQETTSQESMS